MSKVWLSLLAMLLIGPSAGPALVGVGGLPADIAAADTGASLATAIGQQGGSFGDSDPAGSDVAGGGESSDLGDSLLQLALEGAGKNSDFVAKYGDCNYGGSNDDNLDCNEAGGGPDLATLPFLITRSGGGGVAGTGWGGDGDFDTNRANGGGFPSFGSGLVPGTSGSGGDGSADGGNLDPPTPMSGPAWPQITVCLICGPGPGTGLGITPVPKPPVVPLIAGPTSPLPPVEFDLTPLDPGTDNPTGSDPPTPQNVPEPRGPLLFGAALAYLTWLRRRHSIRPKNFAPLSH
jgi:hypothetical protein